MSSESIVVEITAATDSAGTVQTFYVTDRAGFVTGPSDTPANTPVAPRLLSAGSYKREMFSGDSLYGPSRPSWGNLVLANADGALDAWGTYGFSGRSVVARIGRIGDPYPGSWTTLFSTQALDASVGFTEATLRLRSKLDLLSIPVCSTRFQGSGGLDGSADLASVRLGRIYGSNVNVPAVLVDSSTKIYCVSDKPSSAVSTVYDGGIALSPGATYPDTTTLQGGGTAPSAGQFRAYLGGPTYVRLGSTPTYAVSATATGPLTSGTTYAFGSVVADAGIAGAAATSLGVRAYVSGEETYLELLTEQCLARPSFFGFDASGTFFGSTLADPSGGSPVFEFNRSNLLSVERSAPTSFPLPVWRVQVNSDANYSYRSQLSGAALEQFRRPFFNAEMDYDASIKAKHTNARELAINSRQTYTGAAALWLALHKLDRDQMLIEVPISSEIAAIDVGSVVTLKLGRFGLTSGKKFAVVACETNFGARRAAYTLWG